MWELRGNNDEKEFYDKHIIPLLKRVYDFPFEGKHRSGGKNGCYGIRCTDKAFHALLYKGGFPPGKKTRTVEIPRAIMSGEKKVSKQGFCAGCSQQMVACASRKNSYLTIPFANASFTLTNQVEQPLTEFGIKTSTWTYIPKKRGGPSKHLRISGKVRCKQFMEEIGLINIKQLQKMKSNI
ncbi:hypothetical protein JXA12_00985 [Candidatus Woesearchaeota archaeon]|nr:hypothetical protein [Candidatus Woesearchaeota archaeon]